MKIDLSYKSKKGNSKRDPRTSSFGLIILFYLLKVYVKHDT